MTEQIVPDHVEKRLFPIVLNMLAKKNYSELKLRSICEKAGMGPSTIYKYYGSKEGLALRLVDTHDQLLADFIRANLDMGMEPKTKWREFYRQLFTYYDQNPKAAILLNISMPTGTWFLSEQEWPVVGLLTIIRRMIADDRATGALDPEISDNQIIAEHYMHVVREVRLWRSRNMKWKLIDRLDNVFPIIWKTISTPAGSS